MSLRYWNSCAERSRLARLITLSANLLEEDLDDDDGTAVDSVDSSLSLESLDSLDSSLSLDSLFSYDSISTSSSCSTVGLVVGETIRFHQYVYRPIVESEITSKKITFS